MVFETVCEALNGHGVLSCGWFGQKKGPMRGALVYRLGIAENRFLFWSVYRLDLFEKSERTSQNFYSMGLWRFSRLN